MKITPQHFSGAFFVLGISCWVIVIWNHFDQNSLTTTLVLPAIVFIGAVIVIEEIY